MKKLSTLTTLSSLGIKFSAVLMLFVLVLRGDVSESIATAQSLEILNGDPVPRDVRDLYDRGL
ncbi:MAG: hypothetical protein ACON4H_08405, partial [Rubripirellula sp.]